MPTFRYAVLVDERADWDNARTVHTDAVHVTALTPRQRRVLVFITDCTGERGYPPTLQEIADAVGISSPSAVRRLLDAVQAKGWILRAHGQRRAITVLPPPVPAVHAVDGAA